MLDACDFEAEPGTPREEAAIAEQQRVIDAMAAVAHQIADMVATTPAGLAARAMAMGRSDPRHQLDHDRGTSKVLLDALLRDGAALAGVPTPNPDAELLALRPDYERLWADYVACSAPDVPDEKATPTFVAFDKFCARVAQMPPAVTSDGRALQAVCVLHQLSYVADWRGADRRRGPGVAGARGAGGRRLPYPVHGAATMSARVKEGDAPESTAPASAEPDAELIALVAKAEAADDHSNAIGTPSTTCCLTTAMECRYS